jgi:hypothetical protein
VAGPSLRTLPMKGEVLVASLPGLLLEEHFCSLRKLATP